MSCLSDLELSFLCLMRKPTGIAANPIPISDNGAGAHLAGVFWTVSLFELRTPRMESVFAMSSFSRTVFRLRPGSRTESQTFNLLV